MAIRVIRDQGLRLAGFLESRELASPVRRGGAFAIDMMLLVIPSIAAGLLGAWLALSIRQPAALEAMIDLISGRANDPAVAAARLKDLLPLMVEYRMPGTPVEAVAAYQAGDLDRAFEHIKDMDLVIVLDVSNGSAPLEEGIIRIEIGRLIPYFFRLVAFYGVAALYFSWLTSRRSGATAGKKWLGLQVIRVDGGRLGLFEAFERFVGYFQIPASFGTALLDLWRDPNRRLPHDRLVGTVVLRERGAAVTDDDESAPEAEAGPETDDRAG